MTDLSQQSEEAGLIGSLSAPYATIDEAGAACIAAASYGISGRFTRLETEKDDTFRIEQPDGTKLILKIANPSESVAEIDMQVRLLQHIQQHDRTLPVPRVVVDLDGHAYFPITDRMGKSRQVRLLTYLDGTPLDSTTSSAIERERVGRILGRLRLATAGFSHPADSRYIAWDVRHLAALRPLLSEIADPARKALLAAGLDRYEALAPRIAALRTQVLHNDFSKSNLVVNPRDEQFVVGVIDFGDAVRTAIAVDVSTALLNQLPRPPGEDSVFFGDALDVLRGYLQVAELQDEELALLPHLVMGRVITRALLTLWRARRFPENATYILRNTEQGWHQLDWFLRQSTQEVSEHLSQLALS